MFPTTAKYSTRTPLLTLHICYVVTLAGILGSCARRTVRSNRRRRLVYASVGL